MRCLAICAGTPQPIAAKSGRTGHFKTPLPGAEIGPLGVMGDHIVDTDHHGGPDQAIYLFGEADRVWWSDALNRPLPAGFFGENLLIEGLASADLALGDVLVVGSVRLQITAPRIPCVTFAVRIGDPDGVKRFIAANRTGAYARVLRPGAVHPLDPVALHPFPGERIPIPEHFARFMEGRMDDDYLRRTLAIPAHTGLHDLARARLKDIP